MVGAEPSLAVLAPLRSSLEGKGVTVRVGAASHPPHPQKRTLLEATSWASWGFRFLTWSELNPRLRCSLRCAPRSRERASLFAWGLPPIPHTPRSGHCSRRRRGRRGVLGF